MQQQQQPLKPASRNQRHFNNRGRESIQNYGGQGRNKKIKGSGRRGWGEAANTEKLRQKEEREIKELEARIEVEMPLPGLNWVPLITADAARLQGATPRSAAAATAAPASAGAGSSTAGEAAGAELTRASDGSATATEDGNGRALAAAHAAASAAEEGGNVPTLSRYFFADLPLSSNTQRGLRGGGFVLLSQIQLRVIPHALRGADVMGEAKTGSGKTLAFLVPVLECLYRGRISSIDGVSALILAPTRELAVQIFNVVKVVSKYHEFSAGCLIGGKNVAEEAERVHTLNIVVGTPGRVLQHTEESQLWDATNLKILVIDEADRLADMGFIQTTRYIIEQLPRDRQTLFFSATLRTAVKRLASFAARPDAQVISVGGGGGLSDCGLAANGNGNSSSSGSSCSAATPLTLTQSYMIVPPQFKLSALFSFLRTHSNKKSLVFVSSCKQARFVAEAFKLLKPGPKLFFLHGRQKQARRIEVFHAFVQRSPACCLISTDLASRGIDFAQLSVGMLGASRRRSSTPQNSNRDRQADLRQQGPKGRAAGREAGHGSGDFRSAAKGAAAAAVDFVVQLDCPDSVETYIHRVGRTARMQRSGHALLLLLPSERAFISRLKSRKIEPKEAFINPQRAVKIENKLQALLASNVELKQLAQQALGCYLRCIALMPDKQVFSLPSDRQTLTLFANGYGLQLPPKITFVSTNTGTVDSGANKIGCLQEKTNDGGEDIRTCGGALGESRTKKKNMSKLERLKEKIRQKQLEKQQRRRLEGSSTAGGDALSQATTPSTAREAASVTAAATSQSKKTEAAAARDAAAAADEVSTSGGDSDSSSGGRRGGSGTKRAHCGSEGQPEWQGGEKQDESDKQLFLVRKRQEGGEDEDGEDTQRLLLQEQLIQKPGFKRERLRFRADGSAKVKGLAAAELPRQHVFFEEEEHEEEGEDGDLATSMKDEAKKSKSRLMLADASAVETTADAEESALIDEGHNAGCSGGRRDAFLAKMRTRLLLQEAADKERDRQRIHDRHTHKRVRERLRRKAEAAGLKGHAAGGQAASVPTAALRSASDVQSDSEHATDEDEDIEEGEGGMDTNSTGDDYFQHKKSPHVVPFMKVRLRDSTKKRSDEAAEKRETGALKEPRQNRQDDVQRQRLLKKRKLLQAEETSDTLRTRDVQEDSAASGRSPVETAEHEAERLERVALQLLQNGITNHAGLL